MGIGLGVFLIVLGAVLGFSTLDTQYLNTDLNTVGYILILVGLLALAVGTFQNYQRSNPKLRGDNRVERRTQIIEDPSDPAMDRRVVEERRVEEL